MTKRYRETITTNDLDDIPKTIVVLSMFRSYLGDREGSIFMRLSKTLYEDQDFQRVYRFRKTIDSFPDYSQLTIRCRTFIQSIKETTYGPALFHTYILTPSLRSLILPRNHDMSYLQSLPRTLTYLDVYTNEDETLLPGILPPSLTGLILSSGTCIPFQVGSLPEGLLTLKISNLITYEITPGMLPSSLTHLDFTDNQPYNTAFPIGALPQGLLKLDLNSRYNQPFEEGVLPSTVTCLYLRSRYDQPIASGVLSSSSLRLLKISGRFNRSFDPGVLPDSLEELYLSGGYDQPFVNGSLPSKLRILILRCVYSRPFETGVLPNSLVHLGLGGCFNQYIMRESLPSSLISLSMGSRYNQPILPTYLPIGLKFLRVYVGYRFVINLQGTGVSFTYAHSVLNGEKPDITTNIHTIEENDS